MCLVIALVAWAIIGLPLFNAFSNHSTSMLAEHPLSEILSWWSQIVLATIALLAAIVAYLQLRAYKLLEMLKLVEDLEIRAARRTVLKELPKLKRAEWWDDSDEGKRLEQDAADVCASYDILGLMIENDKLGGGYGSFFEKYWAHSIVSCHEELQEYLRYRRQNNPQAYEGFSRLAKKCAVFVKSA